MPHCFDHLRIIGLIMLLLVNAEGVQAGTEREVHLRGEYGFLTRFDCQPEAEARARISTMATVFGIREFQFYDWFASYSQPVMGNEWKDPFFHKRQTCRRTLEIYIDEIHRHGARAWAYVQAVGATETDMADPTHGIYQLIDKNGDWYWHAPELPDSTFPTYFANAAWAEHQVVRWAPAIRRLGFDGIHWDTLGRIAGSYGAETAGMHAFLEKTHQLLETFQLKQTMNFVDMAWWDQSRIKQFVEFPYVEVWSSPSAQRYMTEMDSAGMAGMRGVFALYPSVDVPPGWTESQVMIHRRNQAAKHNLDYLVIGDGARRMKNQYWPETIELTPDEIAALRQPRSAGEPTKKQ
jgi:hypothetical protein